jgi:hypothetical protein
MSDGDTERNSNRVAVMEYNLLISTNTKIAIITTVLLQSIVNAEIDLRTAKSILYTLGTANIWKFYTNLH